MKHVWLTSGGLGKEGVGRFGGKKWDDGTLDSSPPRGDRTDDSVVLGKWWVKGLEKSGGADKGGLPDRRTSVHRGQGQVSIAPVQKGKFG